MHQIEALPVRNISLSRNWVSQASETNYQQAGKHKNSKNFLFMRAVHQKKVRKLSTPIDNQRSEAKEKLVRPKTSLICYRDMDEIGANSCINSHKHSSQKIGNFNTISPALLHTPGRQSISQGLKNYFPQRKPKKNKDTKWHQYYTLLSMKQFTIQFAQNPKITVKEKEKHQFLKNRGKSLMRNPAPNSQVKKNRGKQGNQALFQKFQNIQISPWYTPVQEGEKLHHTLHQHKIL